MRENRTYGSVRGWRRKTPVYSIIPVLLTKGFIGIENDQHSDLICISQADMYQMYAYSKKYETSEVWLLYPINEDMRDHKPIEFYSGDNTYVRLFFIDIANIEESLMSLKDRIETPTNSAYDK